MSHSASVGGNPIHIGQRVSCFDHEASHVYIGQRTSYYQPENLLYQPKGFLSTPDNIICHLEPPSARAPSVLVKRVYCVGWRASHIRQSACRVVKRSGVSIYILLGGPSSPPNPEFGHLNVALDPPMLKSRRLC